MANSKRCCCHCKEYFPIDEMFKTPAGWFCCANHALEYAKNKQKKERKRALSERKKIFNANDRSRQLKEAQAAFNEFIRMRDGKRCISCGRFHNGQIHAGHYRTVKAAPHLRFNQFNCHSQCAPCNNHLSGNIVEYRINLIKKIGVEKVEWIESQNEPAKLSIEEIRLIKDYYRGVVRRMKREQQST